MEGAILDFVPQLLPVAIVFITAALVSCSKKKDPAGAGGGVGPAPPMTPATQSNEGEEAEVPNLESGYSKAAKNKASASNEGDEDGAGAKASNEFVGNATELEISPLKVKWYYEVGQNTVTIKNYTGKRYAIKMKTSNNDVYSVGPPMRFIKSGKTISAVIMRKAGPSNGKEDKVVVHHVEAPEGEDDIKAFWDKKPSAQKTVIKQVGPKK